MPFIFQKSIESTDSSSKYLTIEFRALINTINNYRCIAFETTVDLTETIKMTLQQSNVYYYNLNPLISFECSKKDEKKSVKIEINSTGGVRLVREFSPLNTELTRMVIESPTRNSSMTCNAVVAQLKVIIKEEFLPEGILRDLGALVNNVQFSDFVIQVDSKDFNVHKTILSARSPIFLKMFTGEFQEKKKNKTIINSVSHEAFHDFLRFLYTDTLNDLETHVVELLELSDIYEVKVLKRLCENQLLIGLTDGNAVDIFQYAHRYRCDISVKEAAFKRIKKSFSSNNYTLPDEFINAPEALQSALEAKNQMGNLLSVEIALKEMKSK